MGRDAGRLGLSSEHRCQHDHRTASQAADHPGADAGLAVWLDQHGRCPGYDGRRLSCPRTPKSPKGAVKLGTIEAPPIGQNSVEQLADSFTLPARPSGFPGGGGKFYVWFVANSSNSVLEVTKANNISKPVPCI